MEEHVAENNAGPSSESGSSLASMIRKLQQHVGFLEKKIDTLLSQSQEKPFRDRPFSRPFRPQHGRRPGFSTSGHARAGESYHRPGEGGFHRGRPFEKPQGGPNQGFGERKKPFFRGRKDRSQANPPNHFR